MDFIADNNARFKELAPKFQKMFGVKLRSFYHPVTGFDVVKFDEQFVNPNENESSAAAVKRKWGKDAVALIEQLFG